jgi:dipeptidyl aminopeptidase/acylaminoacyl peptidase
MFITRGTPASHPTLKASTLPRLIPTRAFYADPRAAYDYVASYDGAYVAYKKASLTGRSIAIKEVATGKHIAEFPIGIGFIRWHPTEPLLRFVFEAHDWQADPKMPDRQNWTSIRTVRLSGGWYKNEVATNPDMPLLTWGKSHTREVGHMWLVSQNGLTAEKIATGNDKSQYWMFDAETKPVLRLDSLDPATTRMFRNTDSGWEKLIDIDLDDDFYPLSRTDADGMLIVRSARGRDKAAFTQFDSATGTETVLLENPNADVGWATALTHSGPPDVVRMGLDTLERQALTDRGQVFLDILSDFPQPVILGATTPTASGRYVTQAVSPQGKSWIYLLIDLQEKTYDILDEYYFRKFKDRLVQEKAVTFTARDGLEIPAVLTMPKDAAGPLPFIVEIHGGPAHNISLGYNHDTQFLVNRGYGVLSVNFRGSTGFGKAFQAKGFKEFGRAMQNDIADAAQWLVDLGMADPDALTAMGTSYGGYAAALAMTRDPGLFDAAIVEFPMLDVEFQSKYHPGFWENGLDGWWRYFG